MISYSCQKLSIVLSLILSICEFIILIIFDVKYLQGETGTMFVFNAGNNLHKASGVTNTKRQIFHLIVLIVI